MNNRLHGGFRVGLLAVCIGCETPEFGIGGDGGTFDAGTEARETPEVNTTGPATSDPTGLEVPTHGTTHGSDATSDFTMLSSSEPSSSRPPDATGVDTNSSAMTTDGTSASEGDTSGSGSHPDVTSCNIVDPESSTGAPSASTSDAPTTESATETTSDEGNTETTSADAETTSDVTTTDGHTSLPDSTGSEPPPLQQSTHGAWCVNPIPIVAVKGPGSILNNPDDDLGQVNAGLLERLTICPGEQTEYCDATPEGELIAVMMRECQLPPQVCPAAGAPAATGCSQTWMEDIFGGWDEVESSHYVAQGCCFEGQLDEVYTETCSPELEGARCPRADVCLDAGRCVAGECEEGGPRSCDDGFFCNGEEYCLEDVGCVPGAVPQFDDDPCTTDRCDAQTGAVSHDDAACSSSCPSGDVTAGAVQIMPSSVRPDLNAYALGAEGSSTEVIQVACGAMVTPSISVPYGTWSCARTDNGEVYVVNEWEIAVSQPVATGCSYEMQYWEVKAAGRNAYEGFVFACCIGAEPFDSASPNIEPLPPGP